MLQFLYAPTKEEIRRKYPSRLTNAEVAQRAGNFIVNNYGRGAANIVIGGNDKSMDRRYDNMSDEVKTDYRWSSMNEGPKYQE